jgi:succinate-semialdehyde dehydrogenase/glutarate-semialdehyde dehydrogenase
VAGGGRMSSTLDIITSPPFSPDAEIEYGLASYVFTRDAATANKISGELKAGMVGVNTYALAAAEVPFGGVRDSGFGREGGIYALRDYLEPKYTHFVPL